MELKNSSKIISENEIQKARQFQFLAQNTLLLKTIILTKGNSKGKTSPCICTLILQTLTIFFLLLRIEDSISRNLIYGYKLNTQIKLLTKTGHQKV